MNICQSYIHVVDLPDNDESVHHTEENSQSEEVRKQPCSFFWGTIVIERQKTVVPLAGDNDQP
ncbi:MAG: hypothetical protein DI548_05630 [Flavobacterium johnsoniae]|nr:MAG: hypothetical protein DI548_05630 [Flavobacterium johnsoniae]